MLKPYTIVFIFLSYLINFIDAEGQTNVTCPNFSYKCPDCKEDQFCSYPLIQGCEGSGMPVCQSKNCHNTICAPKALPCPDECPFNCQYHGPPCCPFVGQPTCLPPCETFVPCKIIPCPSECLDNCFYPDADYCCPRSRQPICHSQLGDDKSSSQRKHVKRASNNPMPGNDGEGIGEAGSPGPIESSLDPIENNDNDNNNNPICIDMIVPCPPECPDDCEYPTDVPCPKTHPPKCRHSTVTVGQHDGKDGDATAKLDELVNELSNIVGIEVDVMSQLENLLIHEHELLEWINQQRKSLNPAHHTSPPHSSPTTLPNFCPMIYIPCPKLCPTTCIRPPDAPCPFAVPGYCP